MTVNMAAPRGLSATVGGREDFIFAAEGSRAVMPSAALNGILKEIRAYIEAKEDNHVREVHLDIRLKSLLSPDLTAGQRRLIQEVGELAAAYRFDKFCRGVVETLTPHCPEGLRPAAIPVRGRENRLDVGAAAS